LSEGYTKDLGTKERIRITISDETHYVGVTGITSSTATINVSSVPQQATLTVGDLRKFDVTDDGYYDISVKLDAISNNKATLTTKAIREKVTEESTVAEQDKEDEAAKAREADLADKGEISSNKGLWIGLIVVLILAGIIGGGIYYYLTQMKAKKR